MTVPTSVGRRRRARLAFLTLTTVLCSGLAAPALAQSAPAFRQVDENGVDLVQGDFRMTFKEGSIGSGRGELALVRRNATLAPYDWDQITFSKSGTGAGTSYVIGLPGGTSDTFTGALLTAAKHNGATLTRNSGWAYTYTAADGTEINFTDPSDSYDGETTVTSSFCGPHEGSSCQLLPTQMTSATGQTVAFTWDLYAMPDGGGGTAYETRLASVANSFGYSVAFTYGDDSTGGSTPPPLGWRQRATAAFHNDAVSTAAQATVSYSYPSSGTVDVTDMARQTWRVTATSIRRPGETSAGFTVAGSAAAVTGVTRDGITTSYTRSVSGGTITMTRTDPLGHTDTTVSIAGTGRPSSVTDRYGRITRYTYDTYDRLTRVTRPEGGYVNYTLDGRGNVTETRVVAKTGVTATDLVATADYPASCTDVLTCNEPTSTTDARSNTTDYTYDPSSGQVATVTAPAPTGADRPEVRYTYALTAGGDYALATASTCRSGTAPSCVGTANETTTTIGYDANGNVASVTVAAGDGSLAATTAATYSPLGDVVGVDGPLPGGDDTVTYRYDAARRQVGAISPDPDGSGSQPRRASRTTYDAAGRSTLVEAGTVAGTGDADWAAFSPAQGVATGWDGDRRVLDTLVAGGTAYAKTQYGYDAAGRLGCTTVRMNMAAWGSLPDACTAQSAGADGPDRITRTSYGATGTLTTSTAYGRPEQTDEVTSFADDGQVASVRDGEGNLTSYGYDGFDRLYRTYYPDPTRGAGTSSTTDYEELGYDAGGNVTSRRLRDGSTVALTVDALNRVTASATTPAAGVTAAPSVTYVYDLLGHPTSITDANGWSTGYLYDALGRATIAASNIGVNYLTYDLAGRMTREQWVDGFYVTYAYDVTGNPTAVKEYGGTTLATFAYDALGRRIGTSLGNGTGTTYAYDVVGRLNTLSHDLAGTAADLSIGFTYNPAGQIATRASSNDGYAWPGYANGASGYTADGLNRYATAGTATPTYDARGNMTSAGGRTYVYNSRNDLFTTGTGGTWYRGPVGLLSQEPGVGNLDWIGSHLVTESNSSVDRRYVYAPGEDTPLVWYEGSGTSDKRWLHTDERGSVVAVSDGSGAALAINRYDEYGQPAAGNLGRFGYTGQQWIAGLGLWDYKARMYSPSLGRFMQTDPIGYGDGLNWYGYVGGDPVNRIDPHGTDLQCFDGRYFTYDELAKLGDGTEAAPCDGEVVVTPSNRGDGHLGGLSGTGFGIAPSGLSMGTNDGGGGGSGSSGPDAPASPQKGVLDRLKDLACSLPSIDIGFGGDFYAGLGGSLGGSFKLDIASGQVGAGFSVAVGAGLGAEAGPSVAFSPSGSGIVSANVTVSGGGGLGVGVVGTRNVIGTDAGQTSVSVGRVGTPIGFVNGGAAAGFNTPKTNPLGCKSK